MKKTAIILGASGATGTELLKLLVVDDRYETIKLFSRKQSTIKHPKIKEFIGDLLNLTSFASDFTADEVYCCIGTTKKQTPNQEHYKKIDFGIPVEAAKLVKKNGISTFISMSSLGANAKSTTFYTKTKGEMENAILETEIERIYIFRPSLLIRTTKESRILETIAAKIMSVIGFLFIGKLKKYKAIKTVTVAKAMLKTANSTKKSHILESNEIEFLVS